MPRAALLCALALAHAARVAALACGGAWVRPACRTTRSALSATAESDGSRAPDAPSTPSKGEWDWAPAERLAKHVPGWAAEMMLDDDKQREYRRSQNAARAKSYRAVKGRTWSDGEGDEGDEGGLDSFTPREIAEDYGVPVELLLGEMGAQGVDPSRLQLDRPLRDCCTTSQARPPRPSRPMHTLRPDRFPAQVAHMVGYVYGLDPIEAREAFADETIGEAADEMGVDVRSPPDLRPISARSQSMRQVEALLELCEAREVRAYCGADTRLSRDDHDFILSSAQREAALGDPKFIRAEAAGRCDSV